MGRRKCPIMPYWDSERKRLVNGSLYDKALRWIEHHMNVRDMVYYVGENRWYLLPLNTSEEIGWKYDYNSTIYEIENVKDFDGRHFTCGCQGYDNAQKEGRHECAHIYVVKILFGGINSIRAGTDTPSRRVLEFYTKDYVTGVHYLEGSNPRVDALFKKWRIKKFKGGD